MKKLLLILLIVLLSFPGPLLAHSGRTDAAGGHRDNNNASGLGYYHFHHGYPPHLHPDGICPYTNYQSEPAPISWEQFRDSTPAPSISVFINNEYLISDAEPIIQSGRTLVPLRAISEKMGATVDWDSRKSMITITKQNFVLTFNVGSRKYVKNGVPTNTDVAPRIINGRTFVPLRVISESLGASVNWNSASRTIKIDI